MRELTNELKRAQSGAKSSKSAILKMVAKGLREVQQIKQGKLKAISLKQLLDEL